MSIASPGPDIRIPRTTRDLLLDTLAFGGVLASALLVLIHLPALPATIPTHFGPGGAPNAFGSKQILWWLPAVDLLIVLILFGAARIPPRLYNFPWPITEENAERQYRNAIRTMQAVNIAAAWLFAVLTWEVIRAAQSGQALTPWSVWALVGVVILIVALSIVRGCRLR